MNAVADELLPEAKGAEFIQKHPQTLRKQRREGTLPFPYLRIGGRYFYRRSVLEKYLRDCEIHPDGA